ncbi:MAG: zf-HC2 domain-containing protein [Ruminococcus sp.]|nr:zf-HC2 domain-containing protein [Ruminococcus sp.]
MDKYKLKCETVRDLLPIYSDKLTSEATSADIEDHLTECEECREIFEAMQSDIPVKKADEKDKKQVKYLRKLNRRTLKITGVILGCVVLIVGVLIYACAWGVQPKKSDLELEYSYYIDEETGTEDYTVDITLKNGKGLHFYSDYEYITDDDGNMIGSKGVYNMRKILPWFKGGKNDEGKIITNSVSVGQVYVYTGSDSFGRSIDSDEIILECSDGDIVITVADIKAKGKLRVPE